MPFSTITWDSIEALSSYDEIASVSRFCLSSIADTLEIAHSPCSTNIAWIEQQKPEVWRWVVVSSDGFLIDVGFEPTHAYAKKAIERAMHLEEDLVTSISSG